MICQVVAERSPGSSGISADGSVRIRTVLPPHGVIRMHSLRLTDSNSPIGPGDGQPKEWCDEVEWGTLDLAASYRSVFREVLPTYRYHGRRSISRHKDSPSQHSPRLEEEEGATRHSWPPRQGRGPPLWRPGTPRHDQGTTEQ